MRKYFILLLVFLMIPSAYAAMDLVFSDWVPDRSTITLDNKEFYFFLSSQGEVLGVRADGNVVSFDSKSCKNFDEQRRICFNDSFFDGPGNPSNKAYVDVYYRVPKLEIDRRIDNNILVVGEEAEFTLTIYNNGDANAAEIYYSDVFPRNVHVITSSGCQNTDNTVFFTGRVPRQSYISCRYTITTTAPVDFTTVASVKYDNGFRTITNYSSPIRLYSTSFLLVNTTFDKERIGVGEKTNFYINITNLGKESVRVDNLRVRIPDGLEVVSSNNILRDGQHYRWFGNIEGEKSHKIHFVIKGIKTKNSEILTNLNYEFERKNYEIANIKSNIYVEDKGVTLESNIANNERFDANTQNTIYFSVFNENNNTEIKNLVFRLNGTDLFPYDTYNLSLLRQQGRSRIASVTLRMPDVDTTKNYRIFGNLTYETPGGEKGSKSIERVLIVEPIKKLVISKTASHLQIEENREATITVQVKNERNVRVNDVKVEEIFHGGLTHRGITTAHIDNISRDQTVTAYTYTIIAPRVLNDTYFNISTEASYTKDGQDYVFNNEIKIKVVPRRLKIDIGKTVSERSIFLGEIVNVRYTVKNEEQEPVKNLRLYFTENQNLDTINDYDFSIDTLNPGEIVIINKEQIRPKKVDNNLVVGTSAFSYQDMDGRIINSVTDSLTLKVQSTYLQGPAIMIEKRADNYDIKKSDEIEISIIVENIGSESASVLIVDGARSWEKNIPSGRTETITYTLRLFEVGQHTLPRVYGYYDYLGNEYRAVSNIVRIRVSEIPIPEESEEVEKEIIKEETTQEVVVPERPVIRRENFFIRIWRSFLGIFS